MNRTDAIICNLRDSMIVTECDDLAESFHALLTTLRMAHSVDGTQHPAACCRCM
jgi:hypothetical protein